MRRVSVGNNLTPAVKTTVYTVPTKYSAQWDLLYVSNHTGTNKTVTVWWYDKSKDIEVTVIDAYQLSSTEFLKFDGNAYVILEAGDEIRITAETGSSMSCINSFDLEPSSTTASLS